MAETEYRRLLCAACSAPLVPRLKLDGSIHGRPATTCSQICRGRAKSLAKGSHRERSCAHCRAAFAKPMRNAIYCSGRCKTLAWKEKHGVTESVERSKALRALRRALQALADEKQRQARMEERRARIAARQGKLAQVAADRAALRCGACTKPMPPGRSKWCSEGCAKLSDEYRRAKKISRKAGKYRLRKVRVESFDPIEVFDRDGWRCQICNVPTPKKLRGTFKPNAPELDHIVPISKGGPHTRANTQCACRRCNGEKSDKFVIGQIGLFTALALGMA